jgi:hypothetical protein
MTQIVWAAEDRRLTQLLVANRGTHRSAALRTGVRLRIGAVQDDRDDDALSAPICVYLRPAAICVIGGEFRD